MSFSTTARLDGWDQLRAQLLKVADDVSGKAIEKGVDAAADIVVAEARARCPQDTSPLLEERGLMKKSIGKKVKRYGKSKSVLGLVGPRRGFRKQVRTRKRDGRLSKKGDPVYQDPANIAHLVEFGHAGPHPAAAQPFMRPAFDTTRSAQIDAATSAIQEVISH